MSFFARAFLIFIALYLSVISLGPASTKAGTPPPEEAIFDMIDAISIDSLRKHIQVLEDAGGTRSRISFTPGKDSAAVYIREAFDRMPGLSSVYYDTFFVDAAVAPYNTIPQVNVVATIEGSVYPDSYYVIGGHFDSMANRDDNWKNAANWKTIEAPGADDNATGVAAVLELARVLSDPETGFRPEYTLIFVAFGVEERIPATVRASNTNTSHVGSRHFAQRAAANNDDIRGMISIDMIGYNNHHMYTSLAVHDNHIVNESEKFGTRLYIANIDFDIGLIINSPPFVRGPYSDHETFAEEGYPSVLVIENAWPWNFNNYYERNPYYHKTTDTWEKLNMELVQKVARLNLATVAGFGGYIDTSVDDDRLLAGQTAQKLTLIGNYPNPFNPHTNIVFELAETTQLELSIYDKTGRRITTLLNESMPPGRHSVPFNAVDGGRNLPSGVYLYRIASALGTESGKMLLIN